MSEEERADDPAAAQKSVKKAVKKTVKKARKRAVKKAVAKKPKASKLERLTEKSIRVYEDYVRKAEVLQAFGADTSGLAEAMSRADGMKGTISATPELKEFLAVSKLVNGGLAEIQGAFVGELLATAQSEMDALAQRGTDVSNLHGSVNAQVGILSNVKASSNELNTALDQLNEIRIWIHGELEREETPVEATPEESPEAAFPTDEEEAEAGEPGMGEEETEEIGIQEGTVSEEAEPGVEPEKVLEEGAREELQEEVPAKEVPVEAGPTPEELQLEEDKQKAAILINETYMYLQSRQEETGLPLKEAIDILDRAGELVESGELETIGDLRPEVDRAIEAEIELRRTVGVELEKCRKDILAANQQGINLEEVTRLFSQAREMFDANDIAGARKAAKTINEDVERITGEFKETVARIEEVKSSINEAREREIDVSKEMNEFQSLKVFISHGEFSRAKELLATINESIIEKIKELVLNEIRQTRTILEKAPAYIDTTEPMAILDRAEEELGEGEVDKAAQSVGESKELAMKIRERYLKLVERSNEISGQLQKLKDAGLEIESLIDMFSSAKEELKEGDFSACEQHFEKTLQTIDDTQVRTYDELTAKINRVMEEVQEGLTGLGKRYPDKNISDLLDRNAGISVDYDRARDIGDLKDVDVELGTLKQALTEREKELETLVEREREQRIRDDFADKAQRCKMLLADIGGHENVRKEEKLVLLGAK